MSRGIRGRSQLDTVDATRLLLSADVWSVIASFEIHGASFVLKVEADVFLVGVLVRAWVCFQYSTRVFFSCLVTEVLSLMISL